MSVIFGNKKTSRRQTCIQATSCFISIIIFIPAHHSLSYLAYFFTFESFAEYFDRR